MPAAKLKTGSARLDGAIRREPASYDGDFYSWTMEQSAALREGRLAELDLANLAEEVEDLGSEIFGKLRSSFRIILVHALKWDHQPERRSRSWAASIDTHRVDIQDLLEHSPALRPRQAEALAFAYRKARIEAAGEMNRDKRTLPTDCPYTLDDVLTRPFEWPTD